MIAIKTIPDKPVGSPADPARPDPEVEVDARPRRRARWSAAEKLRILEAADACVQRGELGALLRREGVYSSSLADWRRRRERGGAAALAGDRPGRKPAAGARPDPDAAARIAGLERDKRRLERRLAKAEAIIDFQKKVAAFLEIPLSDLDDDGSAS